MCSFILFCLDISSLLYNNFLFASIIILRRSATSIPETTNDIKKYQFRLTQHVMWVKPKLQLLSRVCSCLQSEAMRIFVFNSVVCGMVPLACKWILMVCALCTGFCFSINPTLCCKCDRAPAPCLLC